MQGIRLFHDAEIHPPIFAAQTGDALQFRTGQADGTYLSFVTKLPPETAALIRVGVYLTTRIDISAAPPRPAYVRAYFTNAGGSAELNDLVVLKDGRRTVRFNLDGLRIPLDLPTAVWVHVILADSAETVLELVNLTLSIEEQ